MQYYLGVDFGTQRDYTAIALVKREDVIKGKTNGYGKFVSDNVDVRYTLYHLERMELGTPYTQIVTRLKRIVDDRELKDNVMVIADATGVGLPVVQYMRAAGIGALVPIGIHGGNAVNESTDGYSVPKRDLVTSLLIVIQSRRLIVPADIDYREQLIHEMQSFKMKQRGSGGDSYEALMEKDHDDLVLALSYAIWYPERTLGSHAIPLDTTMRSKDDLLSRGRAY